MAEYGQSVHTEGRDDHRPPAGHNIRVPRASRQPVWGGRSQSPLGQDPHTWWAWWAALLENTDENKKETS